VIPRIVRRTPFEGKRMLLRAARAVRSAGSSTLGSMIFVAMLLAALGASAGIALRALAGSAQAAPEAPPVPVAPVTTVAPPSSEREGAREDPLTPDDELATEPVEPVAHVVVAARAGLAPASRVRRVTDREAAQQPVHRVTRGRIHPTSARPGARRVTTGKAKLR
jgi:hypothetical protein